MPVVLGRAAWCARGRRPAREPSALRASLGASTRCPARPCLRPPAPRLGPGLLHVAQFWLSIITFACNSPAACSNIEFASLELQRFLGLLKFGPIELHAKFVWLWSCDRPPAPWWVPAARGPPVPSGPSGPSGPSRPPPDPPVPSALVGPGVLSWLAVTLPRVRYKILPAWCFVEQSGTKLSLCGQNMPNWAILGERGEFCTAHAARRGEQGEFCPEAARCGSCWASGVVLWRSPRASRRAMAAPWRCSRALRSGSPCPRRSPRRWRWGFCAMRSAAGACCRRVAALDGAIPPDWWW